MQKKERNEKKRLVLEPWRAMSDEWEAGKLTQREFCELKNIKRKIFLKWRKKVLREKERTERTPEKATKQPLKHFLPAQVISQSIQHPMMPSIIVKLPNGISLQITSSVEKSLMKSLFELLGIAAC